MRPIKVAFVYDLIYPYSKGGVERRVSDLARGLAVRNHDVHVFGAKHWAGPANVVSEGVTLHGIRSPVPPHRRSGTRSVIQAMAFAISLPAGLWRVRPEVVDVQSMSPLSCVVTLTVCRLLRIPVVVTWHEVWGPYWNSYLGFWGYLGRAVERSITRLGKNHVAVSGLTARRLADVDTKTVAIIPNGIDVDRFDSVPSGTSDRDVIYVGRMVSHKKLSTLIDAMWILKTRGRAPSLSLIGDGPETGALTAMASGLGNIEFLGEIESEEAMWSLIKGSRVFVMPSRREGFGLAVLEALACGTPVIVTRHPDNAAVELVEEGVNGLIVDPHPTALADAIECILDDPTVVSDPGFREGRLFPSLSLDTVLSQLERVLGGVVGS